MENFKEVGGVAKKIRKDKGLYPSANYGSSTKISCRVDKWGKGKIFWNNDTF